MFCTKVTSIIITGYQHFNSSYEWNRNTRLAVLADKDPKFQRMNLCSVIRGSQWKD
jgi:hypothetical protein